jgi:hypothetical protein
MESGGGGGHQQARRQFQITRDFPNFFEKYLDPALHLVAFLYLFATETGLIIMFHNKTMIVQAVFVYLEWILLCLLFVMESKDEQAGFLSKVPLLGSVMPWLKKNG